MVATPNPPAAVVLTAGRLHESYAKVAHGLIRETDRYTIVGVVDARSAGQDAGEVLDGTHRNIPVAATIAELVSVAAQPPEWAIIGVATHGGHLTPTLRDAAKDALQAGLSVVAGVHDYLCDVPELADLAAEKGLTLVDLRKPPPRSELHFWTGAIHDVPAPRLAVLGTDCAVGKRTTTRMLLHALGDAGTHAEMVATGQTGWLQGVAHSFVLDSVPNDFVSGELEHAVLSCWEATKPEIILLEGQSALRNPSGPCGSELLLSGAAKGAILQHAPGRPWFDGCEAVDARIPAVADEISLIAHYGSNVLGVCLNGENMTDAELRAEQQRLDGELDVPVVAPLLDGVERLVAPLRRYINDHTIGGTPA